MNCFFFNSVEENCKNDRVNDHASFNQINELIGYQTSADFCEIWPEHSLDVVRPKCVGDFLKFIIFQQLRSSTQCVLRVLCSSNLKDKLKNNQSEYRKMLTHF